MCKTKSKAREFFITLMALSMKVRNYRNCTATSYTTTTDEPTLQGSFMCDVVNRYNSL